MAAAWLATLLTAVPPAATGHPSAPPSKVPLRKLSLSHWDSHDGLPSDSLINARQTESGYLWIASFDGLARFDGINFELVDRTQVPEMGGAGFYELVEDHGTLWIGTRASGVWKYAGGRFSPLAAIQPRDLTVRSLLVDRFRTLWIGTAEHGAYRFEDGRLTHLTEPLLAETSVRAILEDRGGALWFATEGHGLIRLSDGGLRTWDTASGLASNNVTSLWQAADGTVWVGTLDGLSAVANGVARSLPELAGVEIYRLAGDSFGQLWLAAEQGLYRGEAATARFERLASHEGHSLRSLSAVTFDREGGVWIPSYTSGLYRLWRGKFERYTARDGLASQRVNALFERADGTILIGVDGGMVHLLGGDRIGRLPLREPLPDVRVRHFLEDRRGRLWISSYAGLLRIDGDRQTLFNTDNGLPTNQVRFTYQDRGGRLWAGTRNGGLLRYREEGGWEVIDVMAGLPSNFVLSLAEDPGGNLILGGPEGLTLLGEDGTVITTYTTDDGLPANTVFNTHVEPDGTIWAATTRGLARLDADGIRALTVAEGLPAESVFDYQPDEHGFAWLSSSSGLIRLDRQNVDEVLAGDRRRVEARLFDEADGMPNRQCTGATRMIRSADGRLWVPTLGGVAIIDPADIPVNEIAPTLRIHGLYVDNRRVDLAAGGARPVEIPASAKRLVIEFAALSFQAPTRATVRYRLQGFDDDWISDTEARRSAVYTSLPPGEHTFRVIGANHDGTWNREGAALRLRVLPRITQTLGFRLSMITLLVVGLWGAFRWRLATVEQRNLRLERLLAEQQRLEVERRRLIDQLESRNEQLEHLTYTVSHDLRSPLVTVQGFLGLLERDMRAGDAERAEGDMRRISEAVHSMNELLERLMHLWRLEHSATQSEKVAVSELAAQAVELAAGRLAENRTEVRVEPGMPTVTGDRVQLLEVLQNLIDNAAKFSNGSERPRIEIGCRRGRPPVFYVRDNGCGIDPAFHDRIFHLFQKLDPKEPGTGIGLTVVKRIIERHGGRIWVESQGADRGATFCFTLGSGAAEEGEPAGGSTRS